MTKLLDFEITAANWKDIVNAVLPVNDECRINFNKNGIEIKQVDAANVGMVIIDLPKKCFKSYKVPEPVQLGFSFHIMDGIKLTSVSNQPQSHHSPNDIYLFEISQSTGLHPDQPLYTADIIHGIFNENTQLLDPGSIRKEPKVPDIDIDTICEVDKRLLKQVLSRNDEHVRLTVDETIKTCSGSAESDVSKWNATIPCDVISGNGTGLYDRARLKNVLKSCKEPVVSIKMKGADYPMTVSFPLCEFGTCMYLLAPRIDND